MLSAIRWDRGQLLVAGEPWLAERLIGMLPSARLAGATASDAIAATRGSLAEIDDRQLAAARLVVLLDPAGGELNRAVAALAGIPGARVAAVPSPGTIAAAEHTWMLLLALRRSLFRAYSDLVSGVHAPAATPRLTGQETAAPNWVDLPEPRLLAGSTLGIIGLGRVGLKVAARARAFDMRVIYHDLVPDPAAELRHGLTRRRFDQVLREADIVSLHLPLAPETVRLIDAPELALMGEDALLINTAHGRLIDEGSLIKALRGRAIGGAALDVFAYEPIAHDSPLLALDNVVLTPHVGRVTPAMSREQMAQRAVELVLHTAG